MHLDAIFWTAEMVLHYKLGVLNFWFYSV